MAFEIAMEVGSKVVDLLIVPVGRQIDYAWNCKDHIDNLSGEFKKLKEVRERMQRNVKDARRRGENIQPDVEEWLKDASQFTERADEFLQAKDKDKRCFGILCPDCKTRYKRGRTAKKGMLQEVAELFQRKDKFDGVSYHELPQGLRPVKGYQSFDSRTSTFRDIMQAMADPNVSKIGLYGINGVGKTTLVKEIAAQAQKENLFDEVVMATVFQDPSMREMQGEMAFVKQTPDIRRIQGEIAEGLGFQFHFETERGRASELHERLTDEGRKLLVLDNIWAGLEFDDLGIPSDHKGCKILMTSTNQKVLSSQMGCQNNFLLANLPSSEAWDWFKGMVGDVFEDPDLERIAIQVADRCAGLPIVLIPVAKGLKDTVDLDAWNEALKNLSSFYRDEMHAHVDSALQLSYNLLAGDEIKSLFLLCAQHNSIDVQYLLNYAFGLGLFKQSNTLEKARSKVLKLVNDLKDSCLLLEGQSPGKIKMHDIVRSFAVTIAFRDHNIFTVERHTTLSDWPAENILENLTAVSLNFCKIPNLPEVFECPKLESFVLCNSDTSLKIPGKFFEKMIKLKVLDLTLVHFSELPPTLKNLDNLRTLCLNWCVLKDIAMIGKLKKLQVLSFSGSDIIRLPKEIAQLSCLRLLDLSHCKRLEVISPNVLSSMIQLEELCMGDTFLQWDFEGMDTKRTNASLAELKRLSNLSTLDIHITDAKMLPKGLFWEKLERFRIFIGDGWNQSGEDKTLRTLKIKLNTSIKWEKGLKELLKKTEDLYLDELKGIRSSLYELDTLGFRQLKHLHVENSSEIECVVNSTALGRFAAFTRLESLILDNLLNLKKICHGQLMSESFSNLRTLKVGSCDALENVISSSIARGLVRLEEIKIANCKSLKEIVIEERNFDEDEGIKLPQLKKLVLDSLPQFTRFCSKKNGIARSQTRWTRSDTNTTLVEIVQETEMETTKPLFNERIQIPNLKELMLSSIVIDRIWDEQNLEISSCIQNLNSLTVAGCNNLGYLFSLFMVESLVNLKTLKVSNCGIMKQIIITEGFEEGMSEVKFRRLDLLCLENLPELEQVCRTNLFECPALKELLIMNCPKLRTFVSKYGDGNESVSSEDELTNFHLFNEKVVFLNLEGLQITDMNKVKMIWHDELHHNSFFKLKRLSISNAEELVKVFPSNYALGRFKNVETLSIAYCNSLEEIFGFEAMIDSACLRVAIKLNELELKSVPNLKHIWNKDALEILSFPNLSKVDLSDCPKMKSVFPASAARDLLQLSFVRIVDSGIEEIVSKDKGKELIANFEFPQLIYLELWRLPELKRFYPGKHTAEFPKLKYLRVYGCNQAEIFTSEFQHFQGQCSETSLRQPLLVAERVFPTLEELTLKSSDARVLWQGQFTDDMLCNVKVLHLQSFRDELTAFPFGLIQRFNNLEKLSVSDSCFKEIFSSDGSTDVENQSINIEKIRFLRFELLNNLKQIKVDHVLKNLEMLEVVSCHSLPNLAPPFASFQNLRVLDVLYCTTMVNLITPSTAESLVQLKKLSVKNCKAMREIITKEGDQRKLDITFHKLKCLRLDFLTSLTNFCSADCTMRFPSLEEVIVKQCPKMRVFSQGDVHAAKLRIVETEGRDRIRWMGDLNATVEKMYSDLAGFDGLQQIILSEFPELNDRWPEQFPFGFSDKLLSLVVDDCALCLSAVSSNLLPSLNILEELAVRNCNSVEEVFDVGQSSASGSIEYLSKLSRLQLVNLPKLKHLWSENAKGMLDFGNLKLLKIENCGSLRYIFSPPMLLGLSQLQAIEVKSCPAIEEVVAKGEPQDAVIHKIIFPMLNSITLEDLPNLTCLFSGSGIVEFPCLKMVAVIDCPKAFTSCFLGGQEQSLFDGATEENILFPKLKLPKLSSINIDKIWNSQVLESSSCIRTLTSLTVDGCHLKYLSSSFVVESLVNLKTLKVSNCSMMQQIIIAEETREGMSKVTFCQLDLFQLKNLPELAQVCKSNLFECPALKELLIINCPQLRTFISKTGEENGTISNGSEPTSFSLFDEKVAFPNLERLQIINMNKVKVIWHNELHGDSFCQLKRLSISNADKLVKVFPSNYVLSRYKNLETLSLANCKSLEEIFDFEAMTSSTHLRVATNLKTLEMKCLPKLKHIWNKDAVDIFSFPNLHYINISACPNMRSVFPASLARDLLQLTFVVIIDCGIEEIVSKEEGKELITDFHFTQLTSITLWRLPKLKRFYPGTHRPEFPKLKHLRVYGCGQIQMFSSESQLSEEQSSGEQMESSLQQPIFFAEKVIPNLEELTLKGNDARLLWEGKFSAEQLCNAKVLHLHSFEDESISSPFGLIQRFQNLEQLSVGDSCFKEIFANAGFANLVQQRKNLEKIKVLRVDTLNNLKQLKVDNVLKNLETLQVFSCYSLTNLAPPSASFQNLKVLEVQNCKTLVTLITSATAATLVQLTKLSIAKCKVLREIIANDRDEKEVEITFGKLKSLSLDCLTSLTIFCSAVCTLRFPSLEEVILKQCPNLTVFSQGDLHAPKLQKVQTEGRDKIRWMGDLNATVQKLHMELVGFDGIQQMKLSEFPELLGRWPNQLPVRFFDKLRSLVVDDCAFFLSAVPSNLLPSLNVLKELEVRNCNSVEKVFELVQPGAPVFAEHFIELTRLQLVDLPKLKHVWNENGKGKLDFRKLKHIKVENCGSLRYIFTASMLSCLIQLEEIEVKSCLAIEEIVSREAGDAIINKISFPMLNSITLEGLPNLTSYYSGSGIVEFPSLNRVGIVDCPKTFTSNFLLGREQTTSDEATEAKVAFPCLEKLRVAWDDAMDEILVNHFFRKLRVLELVRFPRDHAVFLTDILQGLPSLENLFLIDASFEEIAFSKEASTEEKCFGDPTQLKQLNLSKLPKLTFLSKDSQLPLVLQNLESLRLSECVNLKHLVPSSVSFECLTVLEVAKCHGLINLLFSSTAESLVQLTTLSVRECDMMMRIIVEEEKVSGNDIIFRKLKCLRLQCLPSLTSFYSGKNALMFPTLEEVCLRENPRINAFSQGDVSMPKLKKLQLTEGEDKESREDSHYAHLQKLFIKMKQPYAKKNPSLPRQQNLDSEMTLVEKVQEIVISKEVTSEDLHASKNPNSGKDRIAECETTEEGPSKDLTMKNSTKEVKMTDLVSDSHATTNNEKDSTEGDDTFQNSMENGIHMSSQILNDDKAARKDEVSLDAFSLQNEASDVSHLHTSVEHATISVTNTISFHGSSDTIEFKPTSNSPSSQIAETSAHSAAQFEHLFASLDEILRSASSSKLGSSSITNADLPKSIGINPEHTYSDHVTLLRKILRKPLSEVSRSKDVLLLLSTLENLKSCPHLNSRQTKIIDYYIEHFDTLVSNHQYYEDQIGKASALQQSVEEDIKGIPELKALYEKLANKAVTLSADKEALMKKLRQVEEEEKHVRGDMEGLYGELMTKKVKLNALPKAVMLQKEAEEKARNGNDRWTEIRDLFD